MKKAVKVIAIMLLAVLCLGAVGCSELGLNTEEEKECSHKYAVSVKEATAEEDGLKTLMCTKCGYTVTEIIPAGESEEETEPCEHTFTAETVAATPEVPGTKTLTCSKCGYSITEEIPYSEPAENGSVLYKHVIEWGAEGSELNFIVITDSPEAIKYSSFMGIKNFNIPGNIAIAARGNSGVLFYMSNGSNGTLKYIDKDGTVQSILLGEEMSNLTDTVTKI